jgi:c-di-GMP-binding flagellar brake protein YcgR
MTPPPEINQHVIIQTLDSDIVLRSRVEDCQPGRLAIAYPSDGRTEHRLPLDTELQLEWIVRSGVASIAGRVVGHADLRVPTLTVELFGDPILRQRRDHARAEIVLDLEIWTAADPDAATSGVTLDISGGGLRAVIEAPVGPGELVHFSLDLPDGPPVEGIARVIDQRDDCVAFELHEIVPADRERMIRTVFASYRRDATIRRPGP